MYGGSIKNLKSIFESEFLKLQMENVKAQNDKIVTIWKIVKKWKKSTSSATQITCNIYINEFIFNTDLFKNSS